MWRALWIWVYFTFIQPAICASLAIILPRFSAALFVPSLLAALAVISFVGGVIAAVVWLSGPVLEGLSSGASAPYYQPLSGKWGTTSTVWDGTRMVIIANPTAGAGRGREVTERLVVPTLQVGISDTMHVECPRMRVFTCSFRRCLVLVSKCCTRRAPVLASSSRDVCLSHLVRNWPFTPQIPPKQLPPPSA